MEEEEKKSSRKSSVKVVILILLLLFCTFLWGYVSGKKSTKLEKEKVVGLNK